MRQVSFIGLVSLLALFVGGCFGGNEGQQAGTSSPSPSPIARRIAPPSPANFPSPFTSKQPGLTAVAGLIQSLPADARKIPTGRSDPFAAIPVQPEVNVPANEGSGEPNQTVPPLPGVPGSPQQRVKPSGGTGGNQGGKTNTNPSAKAPRKQPSVASKPKKVLSRPSKVAAKPKPATARPTPLGLPPVATAPNLIPQLPPLPEPTLAKGIEISGVVDVGGVTKAIVKVPNEPSRTVREGDRLSNGQVLVKRIEVNQGPTPVVILEQYGIEVAKRVGEGGTTGQPGSPTASLPAPTFGKSNASLQS